MPAFTSPFHKTLLAPPRGKEQEQPAPEGCEGWDDRIVPINVTAENWILKFTDLQLARRYLVSCVIHVKDPRDNKGRESLLLMIIDRHHQIQDGRVLLLRCERESQFEEKTLPAKIKTALQLSKPLLSTQPGQRVDTLTAKSMTYATAPEVIASHQGLLALRHTVFRDTKPTLLEIAAVLEVHSATSKSYRLSATMNYWFAGSAFETIRVLNNRRPHPPLRPSDQADDTGFAPDYPAYRFLREEETMEGLVGLACHFEARAKGIMPPMTTKPRDAAVIESELRQLPDFNFLLQLSKERRDQVMAALEELDRQERARRCEVRTMVEQVPDSIGEAAVSDMPVRLMVAPTTVIEEVEEELVLTESEQAQLEKKWAKIDKRQAKLDKKLAKREEKKAKRAARQGQ